MNQFYNQSSSRRVLIAQHIKNIGNCSLVVIDNVQLNDKKVLAEVLHCIDNAIECKPNTGWSCW